MIYMNTDPRVNVNILRPDPRVRLRMIITQVTSNNNPIPNPALLFHVY